MIIINVDPSAQELLSGLHSLPDRVSVAIAAAIDQENQFTIGYIQERKLSQRGSTTLAVRSGRLRGSVRATTPRITGKSITTSIGTNVKYAAVHEFGTAPYIIRPKNKKALRFSVGTAFHFAKQVRHPGFLARRMFQTGVEERRSDYTEAITTAVKEVLA